LVAYPSFEEYVVRNLPSLGQKGLHLAIGDVDDLRTYVTSERSANPMMFGHIAGNRCMQIIGSTVKRWALDWMAKWPVLLCATFGGDEVVVAGTGRPYKDFVCQIENLAAQIRLSAPCPCSFACGTLGPGPIAAAAAEGVYQSLVSKVDRALFAYKARCKSSGLNPVGYIVDVGRVDVYSLGY